MTLRQHVPYGTRRALSQLGTELKVAKQARKGRRHARAYAQREGLRLNIGCGPTGKDGWLNLDLEPSGSGELLSVDLRERLPLPDGSAAEIYSEHFLEHVDYPELAETVLRDWCRVLAPGGRIRVVVPDIEMVLHAYVNGGDEGFYAAQRRWHPSELVTQMEHVNFNFRQAGEHRYAYDFETLQQLLERCGFEAIERSSYREGMDREDRIVGSLYVEARKP